MNEAVEQSAEIVGSLGQAEFPDICIKCGRHADRELMISRLFLRTGTNKPSQHVLGEVRAPVCTQCLRIHEQEKQPVTEDIKKKLLGKWLAHALPYLLPLGADIWFAILLISGVFEGVMRDRPGWYALIWLALALLFGAGATKLYQTIRKKGRMLIYRSESAVLPHNVQVEAGPLGSRFIVPVKPTSIQRALNFTDDISEHFDGERHRFTFENSEVAGQFAERNAGRVENAAVRYARLTPGSK